MGIEDALDDTDGLANLDLGEIDIDIIDEKTKPRDYDESLFSHDGHANRHFLDRRKAQGYLRGLLGGYAADGKRRLMKEIIERAKVKEGSEQAERLGRDDLYAMNVITYHAIAVRKGKYVPK